MTKAVKKIGKGIKTGASSLGKYAKSGVDKAWELGVVEPIKASYQYSGLEDVVGGVQDYLNKPYEEMEKAQRSAQRQQAELEAQARLMQSNLSRDLRGENIAEVIAGGSSEVAGMSGNSRRRRRGSGLTSSLQV